MGPIGRHSSSEVFVKIFRVVGMWFPEERSYLYSFYAFVIFFFFVCMYATFSVVFLLSAKNVDDATQGLFMLVICVQQLVNAACCLYFNKRIRKLLHRLHNDFEIHTDDERNLINMRLRGILKILIPYFILNFVCASVGSIFSALKTSKTELPFPTWHPLDWTNDKLSYWLAWSHISLATYIAIGNTPTLQVFSSYLMVFISVLMDVLGQRLRSLWSNANTNEKLDDSSGLIECIQMHQKILEVLNEYKICFSHILLYVVCSTALSLCCTVYQLVQTNEDLSAYLFLITFFMIMNGQLFLPCYFGNELILHGNDLFKQTYCSNWMAINHGSKKGFIYLRERLKLGNEIVVGKIFPISLHTYTTACLHAYRMFTLLQSLG